MVKHLLWKKGIISKLLSSIDCERMGFSQLMATKEGTNKLSLLRRADWRFLLKNPHPRRSVCFADGRISKAVTLVSQETVSPGKANPGSCDLAVVSDPSERTIDAALKSLKPGGMLYGEWYSPLTGGSQGIRRQLEAAGFREIDCYWPWPSPGQSSTRFWLPLEAPGTLDYFLSNRPPSRSLQEGFTRWILRSIWRIAHLVKLLVPVCVTASKQDYDSSRSMGNDSDLFNTIRDGWEEWGLGPRPCSIHWMMLTEGIKSTNKVVKFIFSNSDPEPSLVVKHARVPETIPMLEREARNLERLRQQSGGGLRSVPRLLFLHPLQDSLALAETVVAGHPMVSLLTAENYGSFANKATQWIGQLVRTELNIPRPEWWERNAEPILVAFERKFGEELGQVLIGEIRNELLQLETLPAAFEHRDFSAWNILITEDGELFVLDWDDAEPDGLPGMDLIFFLTTLALFHEGAMTTGKYRQAYKRAQDPRTFTGSVQEECLRLYFDAVRLDPKISRPLRLLAWSFHSLADFPRIGTQEYPSGAKYSNPFIQFLLEDLGVTELRYGA